MAAPDDAEDDCEHIAGDGEYAIEVVSGSRHQDALEWLVRGRGENPTDYECTAILVQEPENPFDPSAVSVTILGVRVGYLPPDAATSMNAAMQTWGFDRATCEAIIEGGWYRNADDKGDFCVLLDANPEFMPAGTPAEDRRPLLPVVVAVAAGAPKIPFDLKSMGLGAIATFAMFLLIGFVWLVVQPSTPSVTSNQASIAPPAPTQQREIAAPAETRLDPTAAAATLDRQPSIANPETSRLSDLRSSSAVAEAVKDRLPMPSPVVANRPPPVDTAVALASPARETAAAAPDTGHLQKSADVTVVRKLPIVAIAPVVAEEVSPELRRRRSIDTPATSVADEVRPPLAAAISPFALLPVLPPAPQVARVTAPSPAAVGAAARKPNAETDATQAAAIKDTGAGDRRASGPAGEMIRDTPPAPPPAPPIVSAATPDTKAGSDSRRPRASARSQVELRAARARAKSQNAARYTRRTRLAVQSEPEPSASPPRPVFEAAWPQVPMATRMLEGWAREWSTGAALPPLVARPRTAQ